MKIVGSRELKNRLGRYLGLVGKGETIIVTDRGRPVARLLPPASDNDKALSVDGVLRRLEAEGNLRMAKRKSRSFKPFPSRGKPASKMILEDRD